MSLSVVFAELYMSLLNYSSLLLYLFKLLALCIASPDEKLCTREEKKKKMLMLWLHDSMEEVHGKES